MIQAGQDRDYRDGDDRALPDFAGAAADEGRRGVDNAAVVAVVAETLAEATAGLRDPDGAIVERVGCSRRAAKNWRTRQNAPQLVEALLLMRAYPALQAKLMALIGMAEGAAHPEVARQIEGLIATWRSLRGEDTSP